MLHLLIKSHNTQSTATHRHNGSAHSSVWLAENKEKGGATPTETAGAHGMQADR